MDGLRGEGTAVQDGAGLSPPSNDRAAEVAAAWFGSVDGVSGNSGSCQTWAEETADVVRSVAVAAAAAASTTTTIEP